MQTFFKRFCVLNNENFTIFLNILFWEVRFFLLPSLSEQQTALSVGLPA